MSIVFLVYSYVARLLSAEISRPKIVIITKDQIKYYRESMRYRGDDFARFKSSDAASVITVYNSPETTSVCV